MSKYLLTLFLFAVLLLVQTPLAVLADEQQPVSKTAHFSDEKLEEYRQDSDFSYYSKNTEGSRIRNKIMEYISRILRAIFSKKGIAPILRYLVLAILLVFIVIKLSGGQFQWFWGSDGKRQQGKVLIPEQDIHELDLLQLADESQQNGDLRSSVRYHYLHLLKVMDSLALIDWHKDKTNRDYLRELRSDELRNQFKRQTRVFDYVWYGQFDLTSEQFQAVQNEFRTMLTSLATTKPAQR